MPAVTQHVLQRTTQPANVPQVQHASMVHHMAQHQLDRRALLLKLPVLAGSMIVLDATRPQHQRAACAAPESSQPYKMQPPEPPAPLTGAQEVRDVITLTRSGRDADPATTSVSIRLLFPPSSARRQLPAAAAGPVHPNTLAVLSPGFLVQSNAYDSYLAALLALGVPVVTYDVRQTATDALDDLESTQVLQSVMAWSDAQPQLQAALGSTGPPVSFFLAGHSRGGKISMLAALADVGVDVSQGMWDNKDWARVQSIPGSQQGGGRVQGLLLMDPADGSFETMEGPRFPSAARMWGRARQEGVQLPPLLVVGAGRNRDCIPVKANYNRFFQEAGSPSALVVLRDAGHFSVLDSQTMLQQSVCGSGKADAAAVRAAVAHMLQLWAAACCSTGSTDAQLGASVDGQLDLGVLRGMGGVAESDKREQEVLLSRLLLSICKAQGVDAAVEVAGLGGTQKGK